MLCRKYCTENLGNDAELIFLLETRKQISFVCEMSEKRLQDLFPQDCFEKLKGKGSKEVAIAKNKEKGMIDYFFKHI